MYSGKPPEDSPYTRGSSPLCRTAGENFPLSGKSLPRRSLHSAIANILRPGIHPDWRVGKNVSLAVNGNGGPALSVNSYPCDLFRQDTRALDAPPHRAAHGFPPFLRVLFRPAFMGIINRIIAVLRRQNSARPVENGNFTALVPISIPNKYDFIILFLFYSALIFRYSTHLCQPDHAGFHPSGVPGSCPATQRTDLPAIISVFSFSVTYAPVSPPPSRRFSISPPPLWQSPP